MTAAFRETVLVTGGAGFIGSALCRLLAADPEIRVVNLDCLTYAGDLRSLSSLSDRASYVHHRVDIRDRPAVLSIMQAEKVTSVVHLAAETHVDRSIDGPEAFVETNVMGTVRLLSASLEHFEGLGTSARAAFRFLHVSTDEVFGDLEADAPRFTEETPYAPSSPYAASKAASDHFVRAWHRTYGLPVLISNCSNNFGPFQFPEKLVPLMVLNAIAGQPLPVYGRGENVRDWLHVEDHARALRCILDRGRIGECYAIGAGAERTNLQIVQAICAILDRRRPRPDGSSHAELVTFVADRPGHDRRYAIDAARIESELGWRPANGFDDALERTIDWYLDNGWWWEPLRARRYSGERLGGPAAARQPAP
jgi:dTDP-glucose 4,6-dehydratase